MHGVSVSNVENVGAMAMETWSPLLVKDACTECKTSTAVDRMILLLMRRKASLISHHSVLPMVKLADEKSVGAWHHGVSTVGDPMSRETLLMLQLGQSFGSLVGGVHGCWAVMQMME